MLDKKYKRIITQTGFHLEGGRGRGKVPPSPKRKRERREI